MPNIIEETIKKIDTIVLFFRQVKPELKKLVKQLRKKSKTPKKCPKCHSKDITEIVYEFIDFDFASHPLEEIEKFFYGGEFKCLLSPIYHCRKCGKEWGIDYSGIEFYIHIIEKHLKTYENLKNLTFVEMQELLKKLVSLKDDLIKHSVKIKSLWEIINNNDGNITDKPKR